jgi:hypothetical protein
VPDLDDIALRQAFNDLLQRTLPAVRLVGPESTLTRAHHRRTVRIVMTAFVAALLVTIPAGLYAMSHRRDGRTLPVPPATPTTAQGTPTQTTVSPSPVPAAHYTRATAGPLELAEATLPLDWSVAVTGVDYGCRSGPISFSQGTYVQDATVHQDIQAVGHADVDRDGTPDVVALVKCWHGLFGLPQVVAVRHVSGPTYAAIGVVVRGGMSPVQVGEITAFETGDDGSVRVQVHDTAMCCGQNPDGTATQWRTYGWTGNTFSQTGGPTTFQANPQVADVRVTAAPVVLSGKDGNGVRHGTMRLTIVNNGPLAVDDVRISLGNFGWTLAPGGDWSRCKDHVCLLGSFAVGHSVNLTLPFNMPYDLSPGQTTLGMIGVFAGGYSYGYTDVPLAQ